MRLGNINFSEDAAGIPNLAGRPQKPTGSGRTQRPLGKSRWSRAQSRGLHEWKCPGRWKCHRSVKALRMGLGGRGEARRGENVGENEGPH